MFPSECEESYKAEIQRLRRANESLTAQNLRLQEDNTAQAEIISELEEFANAAVKVLRLGLAPDYPNVPAAVHDVIEESTLLSNFDEPATTTNRDPGCTSEADLESEEPNTPEVMVMSSSNVTVRRKKRITRNASLPDLSAATIVVDQSVPLFTSTPLAAPVSPSEATRKGKRLFADESSVIIIEDSGTPIAQGDQANNKRYNLRGAAARSKTSHGIPQRTKA